MDEELGSYPQMQSALKACFINDLCFGVVDENCDGEGSAHLCNKEGLSQAQTKTGNCIHVIKGKISNCIYQPRTM